MDHARRHRTKRDAIFDLLSDLAWHAHHELHAVGGVRYSARLLELRRLGYEIETRALGASEEEPGRAYRLVSLRPGPAKPKRVKVFLELVDAAALRDLDVAPPRARVALADAVASFTHNAEKL